MADVAARPPEDDPPRQEAPPPFWEWVVAAIGLLLVLGSLGYLLLQAARGEGGPPQPVIEVLATEPQGERFLVRLQVRNAGGNPAAALRIEGTLRRDGQAIESSEVELDYLPGNSTREAGLFFDHDPRSHRLQLAPRSWRAP